MPARIYAAARERLLDIWEYTERTWGEQQADKYVRELIEAVNSAARDRSRWRPVPDKRLTGIFFLRHEHHYIFFRELSSRTIGVISILHESMDLPSRLREDARREEE